MASKCFSANLGTDTSVSNTWTSVTLVEKYDPSGWHSDLTNPSRITVNATGWYMMLGVVVMGSDNDNRYTRWQVNGTTAHSQMGEGGSVSNTSRGPETLYMMCLTAGDYVELQYYMQPSGVALEGMAVMVRLPTPLFVGHASSGGNGSTIELTESLDNGDWHSNLTNPSRVTVTTTGNYLYMSYVSIGNSQDTSSVRVNGLDVHVGQHVPNFNTPPAGGNVMNGVLSLTAGDYVELFSNGVVNDCQLGLAYIPDVKCAMATQATGTNVGPGGGPIDITFDSETVDTSGFHSNSINNERMTIPSDGTYLSLGSIYMQGFLTMFSYHVVTPSWVEYFKCGSKCTVQTIGATGGQYAQAATGYVNSYLAGEYTKIGAGHDSGSTYTTDITGTSLAIVCTDDFVYGVGCPNDPLPIYVATYQRIYGWTVNISDDALETVDPVLTSPQGF